jgi:putative FmdB family regulatory protein
MPLYEYVCPACGARFTKLQPMSAPRDGNECPECGTRQTRRVMSTFAQCGGDIPAASGCGPGTSPFR